MNIFSKNCYIIEHQASKICLWIRKWWYLIVGALLHAHYKFQLIICYISWSYCFILRIEVWVWRHLILIRSWLLLLEKIILKMVGLYVFVIGFNFLEFVLIEVLEWKSWSNLVNIIGLTYSWAVRKVYN